MKVTNKDLFPYKPGTYETERIPAYTSVIEATNLPQPPVKYWLQENDCMSEEFKSLVTDGIGYIVDAEDVTDIYPLIIDVYTSDANRVFGRLKSLKSTKFIELPVLYNECQECSQIYLETTKTAEEVDAWLYKYNFDYVGVINTSRR